MDWRYIKMTTMVTMSVVPALALWYLNKDEISGRRSITAGTPHEADKRR